MLMIKLKKSFEIFINETDVKKDVLFSYLIALFDIPINFTAIKNQSFTESNLWNYLGNYLKLRFNILSDKFQLLKNNTISIIKEKGEVDLLKLNSIQNSSSLYEKRNEISIYLYVKFKQGLNQLIIKSITEFNDKEKKVLFFYINNYPSKEVYNFDVGYVYYQEFLKNTKELFNIQVSLDDIINTLIKSGLYKIHDSLISEFEFVPEEFINKILTEILEPYVRKYINNRTNKFKKILAFLKENGTYPSVTDCIKKFNFEIEESENLLNSIINYTDIKVLETAFLKDKATEAIKQLDKVNVLDLINTLKIDFNTAVQVGNYLINKELIKDFPLVVKSTPESFKETSGIINEIDFKQNIKIFFSYSIKDKERFKVHQIAENLEEEQNLSVVYYDRDAKENIITYMTNGLRDCDILLLYCSENSEDSDSVIDEWTAAYKNKKKILPIFFEESHIPDLISTRRGVKFNESNLQKTIDEIKKIISARIGK